MTRHTFTAIAALLLASTLPVWAQDTAKQASEAEKQMHQAEEQMRQAERQMRDAERQLREAARQLARVEGSKAREIAKAERKVVVLTNRARLGIVLKQEADPATDKTGAVIEALTPGGPAEEVGLRVGDIITKFNGQPLVGSAADVDADESAPSARLIELAGNLKDGDKVTLEYVRGGKTATATVTASRLGGPAIRVITSGGPHGSHEITIPDIPEIPDIDVDLSGLEALRSWYNLDLVSLNPELGVYFGAKDGVLVIHTPKDDTLNLKGGDVIVSIGGRTPTSPAQAMRILRSYDPGQSLVLEVLRDHHQLKLTITVPQKTGWFGFRTDRDESAEVAPAIPAPPAPPSAGVPAPPEPPPPPARSL
jgi:C-terminal processing protease CtpA/Prc